MTRALLLPVVLVVAALLLPVPAGAAKYHRYFGDLHSHTSDSDGRGTPAQAFAAARAAGADFLAVADHTGWFGADTWAAQKAAAVAATTTDFAAIDGYEATLAWGHVNVYGAGVMPTDAELAEMDASSPTSLYDWLALHPGAVAQWNHPAWKSREFDGFAGLTVERRAVMGAIEIVNADFSYEASYARALDRGWRIMPTANSDTHRADWISGYRPRTVLLATELTPDALVEALAARRGYATTVPDLRVGFRGNGKIMGSTLSQPRRIAFTVRVADPGADRRGDRLRGVALVSDGGRVVRRLRCTGHSVDWSPVVRPSAAAGGAHYFFLRVSSASGRVAWTAPIWTDFP